MHKVMGPDPVSMTGHTLYPAGSRDIGDPRRTLKAQCIFIKGQEKREEGTRLKQ